MVMILSGRHRTRSLQIILVLALCFTFSACQRIGSLSSAPVSTDLSQYTAPYVIQVEDVLQVKVFGEDDLSAAYTVDQTGAVTMPLLSRVPVAGLSVQEIETSITQRLSDGYLVDPVVSVTMAGYQPVYIMGEVHRPGRYAFAPQMTVLNIVAEAGGFTYRADRKAFEIHKSDNPVPHSATINTALHPGEVVVVSERFF